IATPKRLKPLAVDEALDWAGLALNRVDRAAFFEKFEQERAVQYFYEPFLKAYDPQLRKELGVWYTPPEIVKYQVERVDRVLREELDIPDGLADDRVVVLDPCCGTGAYLMEALERARKTFDKKGSNALTAYKLKQVAMKRVFGFEILPAPFVIAHLQVGLMLQRLGMPFRHDADERAGIYLTNALTGWEPPQKPKDELPLFPELMAERDAANRVKCEAPILVILGNPPYNAFAGTSPQEEGGLVEPYKEGLRDEWGILAGSLHDLYIRFFRIAERRIVKSGKGIVSYISNFSYLRAPSLVVMRKRFLKEFDRIWIDCMNGDSRETGKLTPDGKPDPSVFSTEETPVGIRVGTAVCLMVRKERGQKRGVVRFQHYWGVTKRRDLLASLAVRHFDHKYLKANPTKANRFSFWPDKVSQQYLSWASLVELCAIPPFNGPIERRSNSLIVLESDKSRLERLRSYLDPSISDEQIALIEPAYMKSSGEFHAREARSLLKGKVAYCADNITRYPFKPFDVRLAYLDAALHPLFSRPRPTLLNQRFEANAFFITRDTADKTPEGPPFYLSPIVCDYDFISGHARHFPILLRNRKRLEKKHYETLLDFLPEKPEPDFQVANLSHASRSYLKHLRFRDPDAAPSVAGLVWMHALAIGFSPAYLSENADGIRQDWPRIPLPKLKKDLLHSA
ncbi:N-6 DNA methylase, partial [Candidatus Sumerlaeota bacterium]|nr:N-6 DNA methylase [Candidatus Sumerlaeota bacterium]